MLSFYKMNLADNASKIAVIRDKIMKFAVLEGVGQTIIYVIDIKNAMMLHEALVKYGYAAAVATQGVAASEDRDKTLKEFKDGLTRVLISTYYIAVRFDQSHVNLVVNYDFPLSFRNRTEPEPEPDNETYIHRVRPFGTDISNVRAVINLLCGDGENMLMEKIERHFNLNVTEVPSCTSEDDFKNMLKEAGFM